MPGDLPQASTVGKPDGTVRPLQEKRQAHMVGSIGRDEPKPSCHSRLDDDDPRLTRPHQPDHDPLAPAVDSLHLRTGHDSLEPGRVAALKHERVMHLRRYDPPPD